MTASTNAKPQPTIPEKTSRREFLNYAFGASLALMTVGSCGGLIWFTQQRLSPDEPESLVALDLNRIPLPESAPVYLPEQKTFLVNIDGGLLALSAVSPDDGCLLRWNDTNYRFENPCHGGNFQIDGTRIRNPLLGTMDQFRLAVQTEHGVIVTPDDGAPVSLDGAIYIVMDVRHPMMGRLNLRRAT